MRIWPNIVWSASKMPPFHGNCSKINTISHKNESQVFTKTPANTAQYWQMFQNQDYFTWKLNSCCCKNAGEYGPILDEAHPECCHFTAKDPESRLFRMKIKVRFHHSLMRIWPNVERNASRLYFAANHTEPRLFRMEMKDLTIAAWEYGPVPYETLLLSVPFHVEWSKIKTNSHENEIKISL